MNRKRNDNKARLSHACARGVRLFLLAALMAGLALTVRPTPVAQAAVFNVNSLADLPDGNLADGLCDTGSPPNLTGICTLRAAIQQTNALAGTDTINLPAGVYSLTRAGANEDQADTGDLDITDDVTITGAGAATTIIDGATLDRVFDIWPGATVTIQDVTIQNGDTSADITVLSGGIKGIGGGIRNQGALTLTNTNVQDNEAPNDAGGGIANQGSLTMTGGTISGNSARDAGGGIFNLDSCTATLTTVTVINNTVEGRGGGIASLGSVTLTGSTVSSNTANRQGGGIFSGGSTLTLNTTTVSSNTINVPGSFGGGIYNVGTLNVDQSTIRDNTARKGGGGLFHSGTADATLTNSTISGNVLALQGMGGGGIYNDGPMSLANVTISGNIAPGYGSAIRNNAGATLDVLNTTIFGSAGGVRIHNLGTATFKNTIVANGTGVSDQMRGVTSLGHNLETGSSCGFNQPGDLNNTDPLLGPLQDNGGPTFTHALQRGSPAIDGGDNVGCPSTDQRGVARPVGSFCDIGAYEAPSFPGTAPVLTINKEVQDLNGGAVLPGDTLRYTINYTNTGDANATGAFIIDDYDEANLGTPGNFQETTSIGNPIFGTTPNDDGDWLRWPAATGGVALPAGASGSVSYDVTLNAVFPAGTTNVSNQATIDSDQTDPVADPETVQVTVAAVLTIDKECTPAMGNSPGDTVHCVIQYANTGDADATGATIEDDYDQSNGSVSNITGSAHFAVGTDDTDTITWGPSTIPAGESGQVEYDYTLAGAGTFPHGTTVVTNTATMDSNETDPVADPETVQVTAAAVLTIDKQGQDLNGGLAQPGDILRYTINYANTGNAPATGVFITDDYSDLCATISNVTMDANFPTFSDTAGVLRWPQNPNTTTLAAGASGSLSYDCTLQDPFPLGTTRVTNTSTIDSDETGPAQDTETLFSACYDFNGNGVVDIGDIMQVAVRWGLIAGDPNWDDKYDVNGDGAITVVDIMMVAAQWGQTC